MQVGSFTPEELRFNADGTIDRINNLSALFRETSHPVIFIQHDGTLNHDFMPGNPDWEILPELNTQQDDVFISKTLNDCFQNSNLASILIGHSITELYITGCASDFCVDSTVRSAHTRGFKVTVVKDGHTTADRRGLTAKNVIDHHNWIWENMIPNGQKIRLLTTHEIILLLSSERK
jgi:nicotinamidase-related amidase